MIDPRRYVLHAASRCCVPVIVLLAMAVHAEPLVAGCQQELISLLTSPDDTWIAMVHEEVCSSPGIATTGVTDIVRLVRRGKEPRREDEVFAIEEHGDSANRPLTRWLSSGELQITVPNKSLIGLRKNSYEGVEIVIKFEPDDPAEREQWLKSLGLPTK